MRLPPIVFIHRPLTLSPGVLTVTMEDAGKYSIRATNAAGEATSIADLVVSDQVPLLVERRLTTQNLTEKEVSCSECMPSAAHVRCLSPVLDSLSSHIHSRLSSFRVPSRFRGCRQLSIRRLSVSPVDSLYPGLYFNWLVLTGVWYSRRYMVWGLCIVTLSELWAVSGWCWFITTEERGGGAMLLLKDDGLLKQLTERPAYCN